MRSLSLDEMNARALALDTFATHLGRTYRISVFEGYDGPSGNSITLTLDEPTLVRIIDGRDVDLYHQYDTEYLDPYWDIEFIGPTPSVLQALQSPYIFGPTIHIPSAAYTDRHWLAAWKRQIPLTHQLADQVLRLTPRIRQRIQTLRRRAHSLRNTAEHITIDRFLQPHSA